MEWEISGTLEKTGPTIDETLWLVSEAAARSSQGKRAVGQVQLLRPADPGRSTHGGGGGDVGVVGSNCFSWGICCRLVTVYTETVDRVEHTPFEQDLLAGERERLGLVVRDLGVAAITGGVGVEAALGDVGDRRVSDTLAGYFTSILGGIIWRVAVDVGVVQNVENGELSGVRKASHSSFRGMNIHVLPRQSRLVCWAIRDVRGKHRPCPGLWPSVLKMNIHWS